MRNAYWHNRCERWGAWRVGAKGAAIAPWARMRDGTPAYHDDTALPELHIEERETADLITLMPERDRLFVTAVYPWRARLSERLGVHRQTFNEHLSAVHRMLARMLDQRRRGEPLDPAKRRTRVRMHSVRVQTGNHRTAIASVAIEP